VRVRVSDSWRRRNTGGGTPKWRYVANRALTAAGNILLGSKSSEFHTGHRAFSRELLGRLPLDVNSDDFVFDNQMLAQTISMGFQDRRGIVSNHVRRGCILDCFSPQREVRTCCVMTGIVFRLCKWRAARSPLFPLESGTSDAAPRSIRNSLDR
jgi:hypothetical protein